MICSRSRVAKHVKSNAIIYAKDGATVGIGAGQMSRVEFSARRAAEGRGRRARRRLARSEDDRQRSARPTPSSPSPTACCKPCRRARTAVIQPGGSIRDEDVIKAADEAEIAMVFTGMRHFRH